MDKCTKIRPQLERNQNFSSVGKLFWCELELQPTLKRQMYFFSLFTVKPNLVGVFSQHNLLHQVWICSFIHVHHAIFMKFCETQFDWENPRDLCWLKVKLALGSHQAVHEPLLAFLCQTFPMLPIFQTSFQQWGAIFRHASQGLWQQQGHLN